MTNKLLIICGPTATGKSELGIFAAKKFGGEIISADSMQIYKNMNIGTAKVLPNERQEVPHHMIDIIEPTETFSVAEYKDQAQKIIDQLKTDNKNSIIVGGTGLYINSIVFDYNFGNSSANIELREKYKLLAKEKGNEYLYAMLRSLKPNVAVKLHPNDTVRIIRALELCESGNEPNDNIQTPIRDYTAIAINEDREILYDRINNRVDKMFELGLLDEVLQLIDEGLTFDHQSMKAIGYKEFKEYLNKTANLYETKEKIKQNSRNYAKRQITWFKKFPNIIWCKDSEEAKEKIEEYYEN